MRDESEMSAGITYETSYGPQTSRIAAAGLGVIVGSGIVDKGGRMRERQTSGRTGKWMGRQAVRLRLRIKINDRPHHIVQVPTNV